MHIVVLRGNVHSMTSFETQAASIAAPLQLHLRGARRGELLVEVLDAAEGGLDVGLQVALQLCVSSGRDSSVSVEHTQPQGYETSNDWQLECRVQRQDAILAPFGQTEMLPASTHAPTGLGLMDSQ